MINKLLLLFLFVSIFSNLSAQKQSKGTITGIIELAVSSQEIQEAVVVGQRSTYTNTIDRKVFNVGKDVIGKTGSVSDLMQNVPSLSVDIDGNLSLRGSDNVIVLINGKPSAMMGRNTRIRITSGLAIRD